MGKKRNIEVIALGLIILIAAPMAFANRYVQEKFPVIGITNSSSTCLSLEAGNDDYFLKIPNLCFLPRTGQKISKTALLGAYAPAVFLSLNGSDFIADEQRDLAHSLFRENVSPEILFGSETEIQLTLEGKQSHFIGKMRIYLYSNRQEVFLQGVIIENDEERIAALEKGQASFLAWKEATDKVLNSLIERLEELKAWLFWSFEKENVCSSFELCKSNCSENCT